MSDDAEARAHRPIGLNTTKLQGVRKMRVGQSWFNTVGLMIWQIKYAVLVMAMGAPIFWVFGLPWYMGILMFAPPALLLAFYLATIDTRGKTHDRFIKDQGKRVVKRPNILNGKRVGAPSIVKTDVLAHVRAVEFVNPNGGE